jgi:insertion element IS1 protein InsB
LAQKNKIWLWRAVNHFKPGILAWVLGDHIAKTFEPLWTIVKQWKSYFYVTDSEAVATQGASGWKVHPKFVPNED